MLNTGFPYTCPGIEKVSGSWGISFQARENVGESD